MKVILVRGRATDAAVYKAAESLSGNGLDVTVLVWDRENAFLGYHKSYKLDKFVFRAPQDRFAAVLYFPIWWVYEFYYLLKHPSDIVHACDLDTIMPAVLVKSIKKRKLFYTIYDFYANNLPDMSPKLVTSTIRAIVSSIEKFFIGFTDVLFLADECRLEEIKGAHYNKIEYIYNSPPDYDLKLDDAILCKTEFVIFYAGGMHKGRGMEYMIKAINDLDDVKLVLAGPELDYEALKKQIPEMGKNVQYIGWLPSYRDVLQNTLQADILFRFNDPNVPKSKYESPNKLFEAMMCGKPIIVNSELAASKIVNEENCGISVPYGDVGALKDAIIHLKNDPILRKKFGNNGRKAYINKYSWGIMERRLIDAYNDLR